jgi:hypothetical protein
MMLTTILGAPPAKATRSMVMELLAWFPNTLDIRSLF